MGVNDDIKYKKAARWFRTVPDMSLYEAMLAAKFSDEEARSETIQKRVRRTPEYTQNNNKRSKLDESNNMNGFIVSVDNNDELNEMSTVTGSTPSAAPMPSAAPSTP